MIQGDILKYKTIVIGRGRICTERHGLWLIESRELFLPNKFMKDGSLLLAGLECPVRCGVVRRMDGLSCQYNSRHTFHAHRLRQFFYSGAGIVALRRDVAITPLYPRIRKPFRPGMKREISLEGLLNFQIFYIYMD